ncbi:MAG: RHS repeat-associated core domain-containing protein [Kangiellaceae bacterium]|jgi:hypothetical protein|nr:RHS repeat-associated core domain-containing protein [Kangiellaceae bacterium]
MQARYYDPVIGRFYANDPLGFRDIHSFNGYAYANNSPYKYTDPDGENPKLFAEFVLNVAINYATTGSPGLASAAAEPDKVSENSAAIRGREQQLIDANGGAKSQGGTSGNAINGISDKNPKKQDYIDAADKEF